MKACGTPFIDPYIHPNAQQSLCDQIGNRSLCLAIIRLVLYKLAMLAPVMADRSISPLLPRDEDIIDFLRSSEFDVRLQRGREEDE
ncbi:unnamed protein product [Gongylonema pulchrum]|uniref:HECT domain-containing protein n=1 Tax=Gongylonema pulchrum TaxID=637853 RepID=A0A183CZ79_9BILA|nr:unnamed protein product [Gongylonema pulchrum]